MRRVVLQPGAVQTNAVTTDAAVGPVTVTLVFGARFLVRITGHQTQMVAVGVVRRPLRNVAAQLHDITVGLHIQLTTAVFLTGMTAHVTQPHTGDGFFAGQRVHVMRFAQTILQTGIEQRVRRLQVHAIQTGFRTHRVFARRRSWRLRIGRIQRIQRSNRRQGAAQIPVFIILAFTAMQGVVIRTSHDTAILFKHTVRIAANANQFDARRRQTARAPGVQYFNVRGAGGVARNDHPVSR